MVRNDKIDNKEFLEYMKEHEKSNINWIKSIRINKKSISLKMDSFDKNFVFNGFVTEKSVYNMIIFYLSRYIKENQLILFNTVGIAYDKDFLEYQLKKLNINYI